MKGLKQPRTQFPTVRTLNIGDVLVLRQILGLACTTVTAKRPNTKPAC